MCSCSVSPCSRSLMSYSALKSSFLGTVFMQLCLRLFTWSSSRGVSWLLTTQVNLWSWLWNVNHCNCWEFLIPTTYTNFFFGFSSDIFAWVDAIFVYMKVIYCFPEAVYSFRSGSTFNLKDQLQCRRIIFFNLFTHSWFYSLTFVTFVLYLMCSFLA